MEIVCLIHKLIDGFSGAAMVKSGKVYATATEDMDALTFGTNILLRHLTFSEARKMPVQEFFYDKVLEGLEFTKEQVGY